MAAWREREASMARRISADFIRSSLSMYKLWLSSL
jgi:hypothetical protein